MPSLQEAASSLVLMVCFQPSASRVHAVGASVNPRPRLSGWDAGTVANGTVRMGKRVRTGNWLGSGTRQAGGRPKRHKPRGHEAAVNLAGIRLSRAGAVQRPRCTSRRCYDQHNKAEPDDVCFHAMARVVPPNIYSEPRNAATSAVFTILMKPLSPEGVNPIRSLGSRRREASIVSIVVGPR